MPVELFDIDAKNIDTVTKYRYIVVMYRYYSVFIILYIL